MVFPSGLQAGDLSFQAPLVMAVYGTTPSSTIGGGRRTTTATGINNTQAASAIATRARSFLLELDAGRTSAVVRFKRLPGEK
jgi:hypothetical protein